MALSPYRVRLALESLISDLDYDVHKSLECDEETGYNSYPDLVEEFIAAYGKPE